MGWEERSNTDMERLLYTVSHELKSPVVTVLGYIDLLRSEGTHLTADTAHYVDRMEASALYMSRLINDLLMLSRIGRLDGGDQDIDLTAVAHEVRSELQPAHRAATIEVGSLPVVRISPVRARQLLGNLVDNALTHAGRDDVHVEIGAERLSDGGARVWVADDGKGVADRDRDRAFEVFERLHEGPIEEGGTGVGLAACRKIVEHSGGTVCLADVASGATVEILLPPAVVRWQTTAVTAGS